jgi:aquaporin Z
MAGHEATKRFTPLVNPPLFAMLNWLEAPVSGASANPARSFGPELVGADWTGWWIYVVGPILGAAAAVVVMRMEIIGRHRPEEARVAHPPAA